MRLVLYQAVADIMEAVFLGDPSIQRERNAEFPCQEKKHARIWMDAWISTTTAPHKDEP
jgi:hypothetical protein